jgi:ABC-type amino acid transport substrate-binding protein
VIARAVVAFFAFVLTAAACAQSAQSKRVDAARQVAAERKPADARPALQRRLRRHARAAHDSRRRAVQPQPLLHRQGPRAGHRRRARARFRGLAESQVRKQLGKRPLTIYLVAVTRDRLLPEVTEGLADIAIGNLTVTEAREKVVDFVAPDSVRR